MRPFLTKKIYMSERKEYSANQKQEMIRFDHA